jgi:hypothetical protein
MPKFIIDVDLDVHEDTIAVPLGGAGLRGAPREREKILNTPIPVESMSCTRSRAPRTVLNSRCLRGSHDDGDDGLSVTRLVTMCRDAPASWLS